MSVKRVAIACQGGGTHAAFTWGVLTEILETKKAWDAAGGAGFDIVAFSGTSAGALCALAAWYGLVPNRGDPTCGSIDKAIERLHHLWTTFGAVTPAETLHNATVAALLSAKDKGMPLPALNPYDPQGDIALSALGLLGARDEYLGFPALLKSLCPHFEEIDWPGVAATDRRIVVGAVEVLSGNFEVFDSDKTLETLGLKTVKQSFDQYNTTRWRMRRTFSLEGVAASGTLPDLLRAQEIKDTVFPTCQPGVTETRTAYYWDGLFSQNPPVRDLLAVGSKGRKPDEIWVVRINSQEYLPRSPHIGIEDIRDRENSLAGDLSLNQELDHILSVNNWLSRFGDQHPPLSERKIVELRTIKMTKETAWSLSRRTKFDRSPDHLDRLYREGRAVTAEWLAGWRTLGNGFPCYPDDARYPLSR